MMKYAWVTSLRLRNLALSVNIVSAFDSASRMADVTLVAQLLHSLPSVFAVTGTPHDVERIVASLRAIVVARKLDRQLRVHILHALQLLCKLQTGTISIKQLAIAVASTDLAVCEHQIVSLCFTAKAHAKAGRNTCTRCDLAPVECMCVYVHVHGHVSVQGIIVTLT